ncbi:MAG: hypothetical protein FJW30_08285 [Acidobacteria bacterium]|nr:hypothetical protein [Acidobacteriota bacterium]
MKLALVEIDDALRAQLESWNIDCAGETDSPGLDAILTTTPVNAPGDTPVLGVNSPLGQDFLQTPFPLKELELRVQRARQRRQSEIDLVHDLRSPLNAMQGYAELISESASGEEKRFAEKIRLAAIQMTERLSRLRDHGV